MRTSVGTIRVLVREAAVPDDDREYSWAELERSIQNVAPHKDPAFVLTGPWKRFVRVQSGMKVFAVDGNWVRRNLCVTFGHGGHPLVHEFIPFGEVWISTHHYEMPETSDEETKCSCTGLGDNRNKKVSHEYFNSTTHHEIFEYYRMLLHDADYWEAHNMALDSEEDLGLLDDPVDDGPKSGEKSDR